MTIELLGDNCRRCQRLRQNIELARAGCRHETRLQSVWDPRRFAEYGLLSLPGIAIDGQLMAEGRLLKVEEILKLLA